MPEKKTIFQRFERFFDKTEDHVRSHLSRHPIIYAVIGGVGVILFWRGVWHTADLFPFMSGPVSAVLGLIILLITGVFVSAFIGNRLILSGLKGEKTFPDDQTLEEIETEESKIKKNEQKITDTLTKIESEISEIKKDIKN